MLIIALVQYGIGTWQLKIRLIFKNKYPYILTVNQFLTSEKYKTIYHKFA